MLNTDKIKSRVKSILTMSYSWLLEYLKDEIEDPDHKQCHDSREFSFDELLSIGYI